MRIIMKNKKKFIFTLILIGLTILTGCAIENENTENVFKSFTLNEIGMMPGEDEINPVLYVVAPEEAEDKVLIVRNQEVEPYSDPPPPEEYALEEVIVNEEEIIIKYEGQEDRFERQSESIAINENGIQYQYSEEF